MKGFTGASIIVFYLIKGYLSYIIFPNGYVCDFKFNPLVNVLPSINTTGDIEEVGCTINNPSLSDYIALVCPKKNYNDYEHMEKVPSKCFSSNLYSPYKSEDSAHKLEELKIPEKYSISKDFSDFDLNIILIPSLYNIDKTIYCRCDNSKTKRELIKNDGENIKLQGKLGLVKIILNNQQNSPQNIYHITRSTQVGSLDNKVIELKEGEIVHLKYDGKTRTNFNCKEIINMKISIPLDYNLSMRMPTVFLKDINCKFHLIFSNVGGIANIVFKAKKTENIDGCDFTVPKGKGLYKNGFALSEINNDEEICTVHIGRGQNSNAAGLKCPYNLTPAHCFKHVLYEKKYKNGNNVFQTFLLDDVLRTVDIEYYYNAKLSAHIVGIPTIPEKSETVRCVCEHDGKKGIMELKISSSKNIFISFILLSIIVSIFYLF
ncbi:6-cysteine protein [Plasmodium berghei]|uniref:Female gametocyte surface protein P47 n=3 Tax=Plasmodium berghei TaxID=5821 RepID=PFS47_PLABA|nr:6-cysteine protein [Plasmodium berghei ANKA]Q9BMP8.1 RecName: Full=Female gametocyte surface protein P47; Flags: Precursor [Plasmodium berghei ANKA]AAG59814.1 Pb47 [Plasmodium berghei]CXJ04374.1 6-cysteine protein [Plasmodium berghei]SCL98653.1 6-cysteine protein [Plasmodium berghei]SCM16870.1 6-cysteine protein [Plasmodium berghei]SCM18668.1 6-cysteine protein [Plasmodium berghei]|eukprot:XP_034423753.1 6-cysteine protein [Plasmodium berghei ANKA]